MLLLQVYIVAMAQERERQVRAATLTAEEDEFGELAAAVSGESLLSLVQPEMKTLSARWLAALKDHALLSLPEGAHLLGRYRETVFLRIAIFKKKYLHELINAFLETDM